MERIARMDKVMVTLKIKDPMTAFYLGRALKVDYDVKSYELEDGQGDFCFLKFEIIGEQLDMLLDNTSGRFTWESCDYDKQVFVGSFEA